MSQNQEIRPIFTKSLLHPRYWLTWFGIGILYLIVLLPYPIIYQLGKGLGLLSMKLIGKRKETARQNLKLCFPEKTQSERDQMLRENFISTGLAIFETGMAWFWSDKRLAKKVSIVDDFHITKVQQSGQGVLLIGIHFLTLELGARILGMNHPGVGVYRPNDNPVMDYVQLKGRLKSNKYMLDRHNTKGMIRALKNGELLWYAPDHDYGPKNSVFAPLFSVKKAATTVGTRILVKLAQPAIIPFTPKREKDDRYTVYVTSALEGYPIDDDVLAATFMNKAIEQEILKAPEQYMWLHRRFKTRPKGDAPLYTDNVQSD
ncbi:LpxL/LpxP family Kdo(2)-lipid IV(A) lauroyl/palmitoleoyl acyltransferase [Gilliamella sp. Bif1-4]|jgi:Kdo2-lipid IVA lauroyltransferase/acyltransferase|uniref:LpxL/LpxP family Kdo(2)-lipid IV(A) lauroyl/palmitoleoyl acyltransferase n=1 Tax=Gilliamella sp. Bif1-4 TaxID=3120233 RepID=UPI00080EE4EA|nr:LpxL/LpxP family Kdo(2)-lipid IV(A) lauroyl/palmitoleoyl acyltransferase [Gilliamella apicola]OCG39969.1 lipid A biosynthesis lauroyl acyltransferase [Gilliamella apicola]